MKNAEREITGDDEISEHVEMVGWGVEEASEANKRDASEFFSLLISQIISR